MATLTENQKAFTKVVKCARALVEAVEAGSRDSTVARRLDALGEAFVDLADATPEDDA